MSTWSGESHYFWDVTVTSVCMRTSKAFGRRVPCSRKPKAGISALDLSLKPEVLTTRLRSHLSRNLHFGFFVLGK